MLGTGTEVPRTGTARSELSDVGRKHAKAVSDRRSATKITVETCCQYHEVQDSRQKKEITTNGRRGLAMWK